MFSGPPTTLLSITEKHHLEWPRLENEVEHCQEGCKIWICLNVIDHDTQSGLKFYA